MKFSILSVLVFTLVAAIGAAISSNLIDTKANKAKCLELAAEIESLENRLGLPNKLLEQELIQLPKQTELAKEATQQANEIREMLRKKYFELIPVGHDIVSLRLSNSPQAGPLKDSSIFKVWVPESRPVWLNFGVHEFLQADHPAAWYLQSAASLRLNSQTYRNKSAENSPLGNKAPRQTLLSPGMHEIVIHTQQDKETQWTKTTLRVDEKSLLSFRYRSNINPKYDTATVWQQKNFTPKKALPFLTKVGLISEATFEIERKNSNTPFEFLATIWLSDKDTGAVEF